MEPFQGLLILSVSSNLWLTFNELVCLGTCLQPQDQDSFMWATARLENAIIFTVGQSRFVALFQVLSFHRSETIAETDPSFLRGGVYVQVGQ